MELVFDKEHINYLDPVFRGSVTCEETMEFIVPDMLPDVGRILSVEGKPLLRGKNAVSGKVSVSGVADIGIVYLSEPDEEVKKLEVSLPFSASKECEKVTEDCSIVASLNIISIDASLSNTRKVFVRIRVAVFMGCYLPGTASLSTGLSEKSDVQLLKNEALVNLPVSVSEKTFLVTDEAKLSLAGDRLGEILSSNQRIVVDEVTGVGKKAVVKGRIETELTYSTSQGDIKTENVSSGFSQIIEFDGMTENGSYEVFAEATGAYISRDTANVGEDEIILIEVHAVAQCVMTAPAEMSCVTDVYSLKHDLEIEQANVTLPDNRPALCVSSVIKGHITASCAVEKIVYSMVWPQGVSLMTGEDGETEGEVSLGVNIVFLDDKGKLQNIFSRIKETVRLPGTSGALSAYIIFAGDKSVSIQGDGFEVSVPVKVCVLQDRTFSFREISALNCSDTEKDLSENPSLTIVRSDKFASLWQFAKNYNSTVALIMEANAIDDEAGEKLPKKLIIPKAR